MLYIPFVGALCFFAPSSLSIKKKEVKDALLFLPVFIIIISLSWNVSIVKQNDYNRPLEAVHFLSSRQIPSACTLKKCLHCCIFLPSLPHLLGQVVLLLLLLSPLLVVLLEQCSRPPLFIEYSLVPIENAVYCSDYFYSFSFGVCTKHFTDCSRVYLRTCSGLSSAWLQVCYHVV